MLNALLLALSVQAGVVRPAVARRAAPVLPSPAVPVLMLSAPVSPAPSSAPQGARQSPEVAAANAGVVFDGAGWKLGEFDSAFDGSPVRFKTQEGSQPGPSRLFMGGLALAESFDPLFAAEPDAPGKRTFVWTRAHPPTPWAPARAPIDADALDLARAIVRTGASEAALHSFGTLVFQRMLQLRGEPEVDAALKLLKRVTLLNATTHYEGSERRAGRQLELMGQAARAFVDWLNMMDGMAELWASAGRFNPMVQAMLSQWRAQRGEVLAMASRDAANMMRRDLEKPWPAFDHIRVRLLEALGRDSRDAGWQEALLRRSSDMFRLDFTREDAARLRELGIKVTLVHSAGDQLLNWASAQVLLELLDIPAPEKAPKPGEVLRSEDGLFELRVVDADHYFPLKRPLELAEVLR